MAESNKPSWSSAPEWANWLACDAQDGHFWYWYSEEPMKSNSILGTWTNHIGTKFVNSMKEANLEWAESNWDKSVEARPGKSVPILSQKFAPSNPYVATGPSKHKRVTLFIDFDDEVNSDDALGYRIAAMLKSSLNSEMFYIDGVSTDRVRIAVGANKTHEINYSADESEFYIDSDDPEEF